MSTPRSTAIGALTLADINRALADLQQQIDSIYVFKGDLVIDLATKGLVLKDTQATPHYWRMTVDSTGTLTTTDLGTGIP